MISAIDAHNGKLPQVENVLSGGKWVREFTIDTTGNILLASNQHSDNILIFKIDKISGRLTIAGQEVKIEKPVLWLLYQHLNKIKTSANLQIYSSNKLKEV